VSNPVVIAGFVAALFTALASLSVAVVNHYSNKPVHEADAAETNARAAAALVEPLVARIEDLEKKCEEFTAIIERLEAHIEVLENDR